LKKIGVWNSHIAHEEQQNFLQGSNNKLRNDDGIDYAFSQLASIFEHSEIEWCSLKESDDHDSYDEFFFIDFPKPNNNNKLIDKALNSSKRKYLLIIECEVVKKNNWTNNNHQLFDVIFTWNDDFIDNKKYFKIFPNPRNPEIWKIPDYRIIRDKFLCMIVSNKRFKKHKNSLFDYRRSIISWHTKNNNYKFDLYGRGWNNMQPFPLNSSIGFRLNKIFSKIRIIDHRSKVWRGEIEFKRDILTQYIFTYAIENACNYNGYILEKIIDPILSGSIPIYFGAKNIEDYIPNDVYIDLRKFNNLEDLNNFLVNLTSEEIDNYRAAASEFIHSSKFEHFTIQNFIKVITDRIYN
jgi:hypothetical protein